MPTKEEEEEVEPEEEDILSRFGDLMDNFKTDLLDQEQLDLMKGESNATELERGVEWTAEGLTDYFNSLLDFEQPSKGEVGSEDWVVKTSEEDFIFSMRKPIPKSTEVAFRMDTYLPEDFKIHDILPCMYDSEQMMKWDANTDYQSKE